MIQKMTSVTFFVLTMARHREVEFPRNRKFQRIYWIANCCKTKLNWSDRKTDAFVFSDRVDEAIHDLLLLV